MAVATETKWAVYLQRGARHAESIAATDPTRQLQHHHHRHQLTSKVDNIPPTPAYLQGWWYHGEFLRLSLTLLLHPTNLFLTLFCNTIHFAMSTLLYLQGCDNHTIIVRTMRPNYIVYYP